MKKIINYLFLIKRIIVTLSVFSIFSITLPSGRLSAAEGSGGVFDESLQDFTVVISLGGAGAVLGLSTLSFVERPGDHLRNIVVGAALGVVIGVSVVAWKQATQSRDMYIRNANVDNNFDYNDRIAIVNDSMNHEYFSTSFQGDYVAKSSSPLSSTLLTYSWSF